MRLYSYLEGNGDSERPSVTFDAVELSGYSSLLLAVADEIDATRDRMADATATGGYNERS